MATKVQLQDKVRILQRQDTRGNDGAYVIAWNEIAEQPWAEVKPLRGSVLVLGQREEHRADFIVTLYYRTDLESNRTRIEYEGRQLTVVHVAESERGEPNQYTQALVKEERG